VILYDCDFLCNDVIRKLNLDYVSAVVLSISVLSVSSWNKSIDW